MNRNQLPTILVATSAAGHLIGNVIPTLEHVRDPDWPAHARFHAIQAIGLLTGMDLIAIALALGPLRRRERWAFWTELTYVLFAQGGYFASIAVLPKGRPRGAVFHLLYACATAMFLVGLLQSQRIQAVTDLPAGLAHASRGYAPSALRDLAPVEEDAADEGGLPGVLEAVGDHAHQPDAQRDRRVHPSTIRDRSASVRRF